MAFDAFAYFPGSNVKGETQDDAMKGNDAFGIISFEIGAENVINIGSDTSGGGAGKATFKEFSITKKTDTASAAMFMCLCEGNHFADMVVELRRSGGGAGVSGKTFLKWEFKLVMIKDITWSGSDGDDVCEETVLLEYGAMKVTYTPQKKDGSPLPPKVGEWSRVLNKGSLAV